LTLRRVRFLLSSCLVAFGALSASCQAADRSFNAHEYLLDNGLQLVVIENHRAPIVTHMVWYRVGAIDEYSGKSGLAHFLEHLMFKGTKAVPAGEFSKTVARHGGQGNAFTSSDYTAYYQNVAATNLALVMEMEADRMTGLVIDEGEVAAERDVVIEERRMRVENSPSALFREKLRAAQYQAHPYRVPIIGWPQDLATLTREDALGFYGAYYGPNNAIVVVVGDVKPDDVKALADKTYGALPARDIADRIHAVEPVHTEAGQLVLHDPRVRQSSWGLSFRAPSYGVGNARHIPALEVLAEILGGGPVSRLYQQLVMEDGVAVDIGAYYSPGRLGPTTLSIHAVPKGIDVAALAPAVQAVLEDIKENGVTPEELTRAKRSLTASVIYAQDSGEGLANIFGATLVNGRTVDDLEAWPENINNVTYDDVIAAAHHVFVAEQSMTGILLAEVAPEETAPEPSAVAEAPTATETPTVTETPTATEAGE
jgi:zinc protease